MPGPIGADPVAVDTVLVPRSDKSGEFVTPGVVPDKSGVIYLAADVDPAQLAALGKSLVIELWEAADKPGADDSELTWAFSAATVWSGGKVPKGDGNPGLAVNGDVAKGRRMRLRLVPSAVLSVGAKQVSRL